jgi:hypothetical protein
MNVNITMKPLCTIYGSIKKKIKTIKVNKVKHTQSLSLSFSLSPPLPLLLSLSLKPGAGDSHL